MERNVVEEITAIFAVKAKKIADEYYEKGKTDALSEYEHEQEAKIGLLRQWLNEERSCSPLVTNEEIKKWLE